MKDINSIHTVKQVHYLVAVKISQWVQFLDDLYYLKWELTVDKKIHPLIAKDNKFKDVIKKIDECKRDCGILLRSADIIYNISESDIDLAKIKFKATFDLSNQYQKKWLQVKNLSQQAIQYIASNEY